jgi:hypothetical protein
MFHRIFTLVYFTDLHSEQPLPQRRLQDVCAAGCTGRNQGEIVWTSTTVLQVHSSLIRSWTLQRSRCAIRGKGEARPFDRQYINYLHSICIML